MCKISVIIPVYNAEKFIEKAVQSALEQKETGEVILIEDGSPDDALKICRRLEKDHEKVLLLRHPNGENRGAGASRNLGIKNSAFDYIAFLDADDYFLAERFKKTVEIFKNNPEIDGVYEAVGTYFEDDESKEKWFIRRSDTITTVTKEVEPDNLLRTLTEGRYGFFCTDGITVRKKLFEKTGLFDIELKLAQDTAMFYKMAVSGKLTGGVLDKPVAVRRVHSENRIMRSETETEKYRDLMYRILIFWSKTMRLERSKKKYFYKAYMENKLKSSFSVKNSRLKNKLIEFKIIVKFLLKYPEISLYLFFWNRLVLYNLYNIKTAIFSLNKKNKTVSL